MTTGRPAILTRGELPAASWRYLFDCGLGPAILGVAAPSVIPVRAGVDAATGGAAEGVAGSLTLPRAVRLLGESLPRVGD